MSMPRNLRPVEASSQGPAEDHVAPQDRLRDALALRCAEMEAAAPEALDLAAQVLAELHARLAGRASATAGTRAPKYRREQLRGEHPITLEDLAWLAQNAPTALGPALDLLAQPTGYRLIAREVANTPEDVHVALSQVMESAGTFFAAVTRGHSSEAVKGAAEKCERHWAALRESLLKVTG